MKYVAWHRGWRVSTDDETHYHDVLQPLNWGTRVTSWFIVIIIITMSQESYALFCMGNPLLDIQVTNGEGLLKKYNLNANDAILADEKHLPM